MSKRVHSKYIKINFCSEDCPLILNPKCLRIIFSCEISPLMIWHIFSNTALKCQNRFIPRVLRSPFAWKIVLYPKCLRIIFLSEDCSSLMIWLHSSVCMFHCIFPACFVITVAVSFQSVTKFHPNIHLRNTTKMYSKI